MIVAEWLETLKPHMVEAARNVDCGEGLILASDETIRLCIEAIAPILEDLLEQVRLDAYKELADWLEPVHFEDKQGFLVTAYQFKAYQFMDSP